MRVIIAPARDVLNLQHFSSERNKVGGVADELKRSSRVSAQGAPVESTLMRFAVCVPLNCCKQFPFRS